MYELIFNPPWWLPALIVVAGVALWWSGNNRTNPRLKISGLGVAVLGVILAIASYLVETPIEQCTRRSTELVKGVETQDWPKVKALMDPQVSLSIPGLPGRPTVYSSRDELVAEAEIKVKAIGLRSASSKVEDARRQGGLVTTSIVVWTDTDVLAGRQFPTTWELDWEQSGSGWTIREIRAIKIGNQDAAEQRFQFPGGK